MIAVSKVGVRSFGIRSVTSPALVCSLRSQYPARLSRRASVRARNAEHCTPIRLGVQECVQRLLHAAAHHPVKVVLDPLIINRDDIGTIGRACVSGTQVRAI